MRKKSVYVCIGSVSHGNVAKFLQRGDSEIATWKNSSKSSHEKSEKKFPDSETNFSIFGIL